MKNKIVCGLAIAGVAGVLCLSAMAHADDATPPPTAAVTAAQETSNLMLATLFAALTQEFKETTPANANEGKDSISLIFGQNPNMRLVGNVGPLNPDDKPKDAFETLALASAMGGQNYAAIDRVQGKWYYRRSTALSNFDPSCSVCHTNFGPVNSAEWVGALMLRVPIASGGH